MVMIMCMPSSAFSQADSILAFPEAEHHLRLDSMLVKIGYSYTEDASRRLEKMQKEFENDNYRIVRLPLERGGGKT